MGVFRGSELVALGIRGVWGNLGGTGGAALEAGWPLGACFSTSGDSWGSWLETHLDARVLAWESSAVSAQPVPGSRGLGPGEAGAGREGQLWVLLKQRHPRPVAVCAEICLSVRWALHGAGGSAPRPHHEAAPEGQLGASRGNWASRWAAVMRSQGSAGGGPRQGPAWVGRGSRKVLRVWVSAWGPGGWVKPCSRGAGQVQHRAGAAGAPGGGLKDTPHAPTPTPPAAAAG